MKLVVALTILISSSAFARQYIQCGSATVSSSNVLVINLQDSGKQSTLFISSGMQNPEDERLLMNIELDREEGFHSIFKVVNEVGSASINVPTLIIGKFSDFFKVELNFNHYSSEYVCFSRIYNE